MRALCVTRHRFLSEHLGAWFGALGVECVCAVGLDAAIELAPSLAPVDIVLCEYGLLATGSLERWERDPLLSRTPVLAVSLTHRPAEHHVPDVNGIAGIVYLPTLSQDDARRILAAARRPARPPASYSLPSSFEWTRPITTAR